MEFDTVKTTAIVILTALSVRIVYNCRASQVQFAQVHEADGEVLETKCEVGKADGEGLEAQGKWVRKRGRGRGRETRQKLREGKAEGELLDTTVLIPR